MNMLYKLIPSGLFKTKIKERKSKNRQIEATPRRLDIDDMGISRTQRNEKVSRKHSKTKRNSMISESEKSVSGTKRVVTSSSLLYDGSNKNMGIISREESPSSDNGRLKVVSLGSPGPASGNLLSPDFLLDVNLKLINTNNTFASTEDLWSYNPEEGHSTVARKTVHFS